MIALKHDIDWKRNSVALLLTVLGSLLIKLHEMFLVIFTSYFISKSVIWALSGIDFKEEFGSSVLYWALCLSNNMDFQLNLCTNTFIARRKIVSKKAIVCSDRQSSLLGFSLDLTRPVRVRTPYTPRISLLNFISLKLTINLWLMLRYKVDFHSMFYITKSDELR